MVKTYRIDPKLDWLEALHPTLPCLLEVQLRVNQSFYEEARALKLRTAFFRWIKHLSIYRTSRCSIALNLN